MATAVKRNNYKTFWDRYSDKPSNEAMMLNKDANLLEESDRADILASLPDYSGKDVVDIGAGIGRFTTIFSQSARSVISTDFIDSFIEKNKERNADVSNIRYMVSDAVHLDLAPRSVDLVFTNWLCMYMSDLETVQFVVNALTWLRPNGHLKLRESCSEPSTGRKKGATMHSGDVNPTHYRYSSLYIQLLRHARIQDADGSWWRFDPKWSASVPTYINRMSNWRQVHWLAEKVPADAPGLPFAELQHRFSHSWADEQRALDARLDEESTAWTHEILSPRVRFAPGTAVLTFNPRHTDESVHVDAFALAKECGVNSWSVELKPYAYRTSLTKATERKDHRVLFGWTETLSGALRHLSENQAAFNGLVATELLATTTESEVTTLKEVLEENASIVLLEPVTEVGGAPEARMHAILKKAGFRVTQIADVTQEAHKAMNTLLANGKMPHSALKTALAKSWVVVTGQRA